MNPTKRLLLKLKIILISMILLRNSHNFMKTVKKTLKYPWKKQEHKKESKAQRNLKYC